jgi:glycosyltransferase involved in cell wall biosynthesis
MLLECDIIRTETANRTEASLNDLTLTASESIEKKIPAPVVKILAIIPAYNEQDAIASTVSNLKREVLNLDILVINDGSRDDTAAEARGTGQAMVVSLPCNLGIGGAVQTGFKYAARHHYDIAIQYDADGQHLAHEIDKLIAPLLAGEVDVTIGSRFLGESGFRSTFARRIGISMFRWLNSFLIGQTITDNTSGFRAYNRESIAFLAEHYPMDYPEPEAIILLARHNFRLAEVSVAMQERQGGVSSINFWRSVYYMIKVMLAILMTYFRQPLVVRKKRS